MFVLRAQRQQQAKMPKSSRHQARPHRLLLQGRRRVPLVSKVNTALSSLSWSLPRSSSVRSTTVSILSVNYSATVTHQWMLAWYPRGQREELLLLKALALLHLLPLLPLLPRRHRRPLAPL
jgi:hypothetical protein